MLASVGMTGPDEAPGHSRRPSLLDARGRSGEGIRAQRGRRKKKDGARRSEWRRMANQNVEGGPKEARRGHEVGSPGPASSKVDAQDQAGAPDWLVGYFRPQSAWVSRILGEGESVGWRLELHRATVEPAQLRSSCLHLSGSPPRPRLAVR